jgi:hypothetical protein
VRWVWLSLAQTDAAGADPCVGHRTDLPILPAFAAYQNQTKPVRKPYCATKNKCSIVWACAVWYGEITVDALEEVLAEIRHRWGHEAIRSARNLSRTPVLLPTGLVVLDELVGGGFRAGSVTGLIGRPTTGMTTLVFRMLGHNQPAAAVYVDTGGGLDGAYAAACGVDMERLLVTAPPDLDAALALVRDVVDSRVVDVLILDVLGLQGGVTGLHRLLPGLARSTTVLLVLSEQAVAGAQTCIRFVCRSPLIAADGDIVGCHTEATLERHPRMPVGRSAQLRILFADPEGAPGAHLRLA